MPKKKLEPIIRRPRLVPRGDGLKIVTKGKRKIYIGDLYAQLLAAPWKYLLSTIAILYFLANIVFACAYLFLSDGIENTRHGSFSDAFFFSVQTMATIGYGRMSPIGFIANLLVTVEALAGFGFFALVTGLVFAKFSRPTARVLFSKVAVITNYEGTPHLMIRLANERGNRIVNATIQLVILGMEKTKEGHQMRRFRDLELVRDKVPIMQLTWTVMHPIDKNSPLYNISPEKLREKEIEIIVSLTGLDETFSQTIHARYSYIADEILCNSVFEDILKRSDDGELQINYHRFHDVKPASNELKNA
jgi:inward rectifier potassium channel